MKRLICICVCALIALVAMSVFLHSGIPIRAQSKDETQVLKDADRRDIIARPGNLQAVAQTLSADPALSVRTGLDANGYYAILENSQIRVRYGFLNNPDPETLIQELVIKSVNENQAGSYLDGCAHRGPMTNAYVTYDGTERKTVHLVWDNGDEVQEVSIFPNSTYVKIDYISYGVNIVDNGSPGGSASGNYEFYGAANWIRGYVLYPESYYNRAPSDGINDPADGGSLNYHGYFIGGIYQSSNNRGYARVMPVSSTDIIKLLFNRGFEYFPNYHLSHDPYTGYLYVVTGGAAEIISMGKQLADQGNQKTFSLSINTSGSGSVTRNPDKPSYNRDEVVTLTAVPAAGWTFTGWSGDLSGTSNPKQITMNSNKTVTAAFTQNSYSLTVSIVGNGSVARNPDQATYHYGDKVTLTATAENGWTFAGWSDGLTGNPVTLTLLGNRVVTATFTQVSNPVPTLGSLSPATVTVGGPAFTLMVTGTNFVQGASVLWNGSTRTTMFVNSGLLTATIPSADIAESGKISITVRNSAPGGGLSKETLFVTVVVSPVPTEHKFYLPLLVNNRISGPDLIVERLTATNNTVQVVVANIGNEPVKSEFWVDVYIDPSKAPTRVNQTWDMLGSQGLVWGITSDVLPILIPGGALTLTVGDSYFLADISNVSWPLADSTPVYAQADSANVGSWYGAVLEVHEIMDGPYNNIRGPVYVTAVSGSTDMHRPAALGRSHGHLPSRPKT